MQRPQQMPPRRQRTRPPPSLRNAGPWTQTGETKDEYAIRILNIALDVHFDKDDREFHGDIRYDGLQRKHDRTLASEGGRWSDDETPLEPLTVEEISIGETYRLGELPLGSKFIMDGEERSLEHYNYAPRPSKGATVKVPAELSEENNGWMINKGVFTNLGKKEVTFVSHPHKRIKPAKSAASVRARSFSVLVHQKLRLRLLHQIHFIKKSRKKNTKSII